MKIHKFTIHIENKSKENNDNFGLPLSLIMSIWLESCLLPIETCVFMSIFVEFKIAQNTIFKIPGMSSAVQLRLQVSTSRVQSLFGELQSQMSRGAAKIK